MIIGNGPAGLAAANEILALDADCRITILSDEAYRAYSKPAISHFLAGEITWEQLIKTGDRMAPSGSNLEYLLDRTVDMVDVSGKAIKLASGETIHYDRLLIATGARQKIPPIMGLDPIRVLSFTSISDAVSLDRKVQPGEKVLVIGGGLIGLKAAEALHHRGMSVTVVEILPWVMPTVLDERAGKVVGAHLALHGLDIRTHTAVNEIATKPDGSGEATLSDGTILRFALAVLATGVEPRMLLKEIPTLKLRRGIVVDQFGKTSVDNVFAAGDVAEGPDPLKSDTSLNLNWMSAREQGRMAGQAMAGAVNDYRGSVALNSLTFLDCPVITMGITMLPDKPGNLSELIDPTRQPGVYRKLMIRDGKAVGAVLVGDITFSGAYHRLIRENVEVSDLGSELLTGGRRFIQRLAELRRDEMEGEYSWRQHVWEESPYRKKMNTHNWKRRTGQIENG